MPDEINDGGPAFPHYRQWEDRKGYTQTDVADGMTLRDYFAAKAMPAVIVFEDRGLSQEDALPVEIVARNAYRLADAMLKARGEK
jgi:hypothetical protein